MSNSDRKKLVESEGERMVKVKTKRTLTYYLILHKVHPYYRGYQMSVGLILNLLNLYYTPIELLIVSKPVMQH